MAVNKEYDEVQLDVEFTQASTRENLVSKENISISFGKISKYFADLHSQAFTGYTHPTYTARTGKPTGNQTPGFGATFTISQITSDGTGHVTGATDRTVKIPNTTMGAATADAAGSIGLVPAPAAGKQTSFLRGDGTWVVPTNTDTKVTDTVGTANTYYPAGLTGTTTTTGTQVFDTSFKFIGTTGTTSAVGKAQLVLGNATASGTANNKQGSIVVYGSTAYAHTIQGAPTAARTLTLPDKGGTFALTSDIPSVPTVNDAALTLKGAGTTVTTFTANSSSAKSLDIVAGSNVTITPDATNSKISIASSHPTITKSADTTSTASPAHGGTFTTVDSVTRDGNGHVTKINTKTVTLPADSNTDTKVTQSSTTTTDYRPITLGAKNTTTVSQLDATVTDQVYTSQNFFVKPSTGTLYSTEFATKSCLTGTGAYISNYGLYLKSYLKRADNTEAYYSDYVVRTYNGKISSNDGLLVTVGGGGLTILGGGESAAALANLISDDTTASGATTLNVGGTLNTTLYGNSEKAIIAADDEIYFITNCQAIANRKPVCLDKNLYFYPGTTKTGSIGTSSYMWNSVYAATIYENGASLASKYAAIGHTHSYLPLSGGTMTGDITFTGISGDTYPISSKGIKWSGGTDAINMYYNLRESDAGELIINMRDDSNVRISFAYNGTVKSYIDTNGTYNGNASTATKLGTSDVGNGIRPIYLSGGTPTQCSTPIPGAYWNGVPFVASDGVTEIGRYIDFHGTNTTTADYDYRLQADSTWLDLVSPTTKNTITVVSPDYSVIQFKTTKTSYTTTQPVIYAYPLATSGLAVLFQSGGNTVIGGGESASTLYTNNYDSMTTVENESLYLASDSSEIHLITNAQTYAGRKVLKILGGQLTKSGGSWISARDNAPVHAYKGGDGTSSSFFPAIFSKSKTGGWAIGTIGNNDNFYVSYTTDAHYSSDTNESTYTIQFPHDSGTLALTSSNITGTSSNVTGTVAIAHGGTGATNRLAALRALTEEDVGTSAQYFLTITNSWGKGGYTSVADAKTVLGLKSAAYTESTSYVQTHVGANFNVAKSGYFAVMANENSENPNSLLPTQNQWWHILSMSWNTYDSTDNSDVKNWVSQLAIPTYQNKLIGMKWRTNSAGGSALTRDDWVTVLDEKNSPAFKAITQRQLKITGGVGWYRILTLSCSTNNGQLMNDIKIFVRRQYNNGAPESFSAHIVNNYSATPPIYITHAIQASKYFTQIRVSKTSDGKYQYVEIYYNSSNQNNFVIQYNYIAPYSLATSAYGSPVYPTDNTDISPITDSPTAMTTVNIPTNVMQANYKSDGTYWGLVSPRGEEDVWIRTSTNGLIPSTAVSLANGGDGALGTSSWAFKEAYIAKVHALKHYGWYGQKPMTPGKRLQISRAVEMVQCNS